jgi:DNA-binding SARP family transcriptional activator
VGGELSQFTILGPLEVVERDAPLPLGGTKQRALLAILILRRGELVPAAPVTPVPD